MYSSEFSMVGSLICINVFLPRDALYSAKRCIAIACRLSVRLSLTLVDQGHVSWKS